MAAISNLTKYEADLEHLVRLGHELRNSAAYEFRQSDEAFIESAREMLGDGAEDYLKSLPGFRSKYQSWYSEAKTLIQQVLPGRLDDFVAYYEVPKSRKTITYASYRVADSLIGIRRSSIGPASAIPLFVQQIAILESVKQRFKSSLFDIRQLVQADVFDSELDSAKGLVKSGFYRAAGAVAGVVMEKHLLEVCDSHGVSTGRKAKTISNMNEALKNATTIDTPQWRRNQHLADLRNRCCHAKEREPTMQEAEDLVNGVEQLTKTLF